MSFLVGNTFLSIPHFIEIFKCIVRKLLTISSHYLSHVCRILSDISLSIIYAFSLLSSSFLHRFTNFMNQQEIFCLYSFFFPLIFFRPHLWHMEVPRLRVKLSCNCQLMPTATATATPDPSRVFDAHHSSQQRQSLNPLSEAGDQTHILMVPSQIRFHCATMGASYSFF